MRSFALNHINIIGGGEFPKNETNTKILAEVFYTFITGQYISVHAYLEINHTELNGIHFQVPYLYLSISGILPKFQLIFYLMSITDIAPQMCNNVRIRMEQNFIDL